MHELWFTRVLNALFGRAALALEHALHIQPANPAAPIPGQVAMEILVALILLALGAWVGSRVSVDSPRGWQHIFEWTWQGVDQQSEEIIGHGSRRFLELLVSLTVFILLCNLLGLLPGFESPTANFTVPLALATIAFIYYHAAGIGKHGLLAYLKTFLGPMPKSLLAVILLPVEIISHGARVLSLTARLGANMLAGDLVIVTMTALFPLAGCVFMGLHLFEAFLQTYIFVLLVMIYLAGAVSEEH